MSKSDQDQSTESARPAWWPIGYRLQEQGRELNAQGYPVPYGGGHGHVFSLCQALKLVHERALLDEPVELLPVFEEGC